MKAKRRNIDKLVPTGVILGAETVNNFINNYDSLDYVRKFNSYNNLYSITFNDKDLLRLVNTYNNMRYDKIIEIPSHIDGCGKEGKFTYLCAAKRDFVLDKNDYSYEELLSFYYTNELLFIRLNYGSLLNNDKAQDYLEKKRIVSEFGSELLIDRNKKDSYSFYSYKYAKGIVDIIEDNLDKNKLFRDIQRYINEIYVMASDLFFEMPYLDNDFKDAYVRIRKNINIK